MPPSVRCCTIGKVVLVGVVLVQFRAGVVGQNVVAPWGRVCSRIGDGDGTAAVAERWHAAAAANGWLDGRAARRGPLGVSPF